MKSGKAAILLAKVLKLCVEHSSESAVCRLLEGWQGWEGLGVKAAEVELFLDREVSTKDSQAQGHCCLLCLGAEIPQACCVCSKAGRATLSP